MKRLERQLRTRNARPYSVKENIDYVNVVSIALITSDIPILSRETPTLPKYPTLSTRAKKRVEKSPSATQHCSLSGRFLGYSLREFGSRRPLEMTSIGKVVSFALTASDISILSRETPTLPKYPTLSTWAKINDVSFALITSDISILSRETPTLPKYPT